jgi:hypothetical protein
MSDERQAFEQLHAIPSGAIWCENRDIYIHPINESWEAFCEGALWQASRQEGEPIGFLQSSGVSQLSGGHPAKLYPIGATPSPFESNTFVYTHPASAAPDEEYLRALQDAFDIIQADANTEENYDSLRKIGSVLANIEAKQKQDHE